MEEKLTKSSDNQLPGQLEELHQKLEELQIRLNESEETLNAIRNGDVDAIIVSGKAGEKIFTLTSADTPYRIILEEMSEGAVITKSDGTILFFNNRFADIITAESEPVVGLNILSFVPDDERDKLLDLLKTGLNERASCTITLINQQKNTICLNFSVKPLPVQLDGDLCIIISDITKLHQYQNHLKELVNKRTIKIKKANAQLRELIAIKNKFFNIIAHDLSNPFTSLIGASELLCENINSLDTKQIQALASVLNDSSKKGYTILQNLLEWTRSQTGQLRVDPGRINLKKTIDTLIQNVIHISDSKQIEIHSLLTNDKFFFTDQNILNTILRNLIDNAIKFTPRNGKVIINAYEDGDYQIISVKDTGVGISKKNIANLFKLDRVNTQAGTENEQGTGLGLKICKEFVKKLNGKISVESTENVGSEFVVSILIVNNPEIEMTI